MRFAIVFFLAIGCYAQGPAAAGSNGGGSGGGGATGPTGATGPSGATGATGATGPAPSGTGVVRTSGGTPSAAELSGDATTSGSNAVTVTGDHGVAYSALATGPRCNTTGTGVPSICGAAAIIATFSGTCNSSTVLAGDGTCASVSGVPASASLLGSNASSQAVTATDHDVSVVHSCVPVSASTTNYTCTTSPTFTPATGDLVYFKADVTSTGTTPALNVNSQGSKTLKLSNSNVVAGTFAASQWYLVIYDGAAWELVSYPAIVQAPGGTGSFNCSSSGGCTVVQVDGLQAAGSTNIWQTYAPSNKYFGMMSDHQVVWRSVSTGSFYSSGATDTGLSRVGAAALGVGTSTQGTISGTIQSGVVATDPGCTTTSHVGKLWFDITTTTTVFKVCMNVAGTLTWVTK